MGIGHNGSLRSAIDAQPDLRRRHATRRSPVCALVSKFVTRPDSCFSALERGPLLDPRRGLTTPGRFRSLVLAAY
jgi:hypothetical protein